MPDTPAILRYRVVSDRLTVSADLNSALVRLGNMVNEAMFCYRISEGHLRNQIQ